MNDSVDINPAPELVLVVDDQEDNRALLRLILEKAGYPVIEADGGRAGLAAAAAEPVQLILLDVNMPDINGFDVCRRLKQDPAVADVPVIFVSARDETADKVKGLDLGGADYITKPFDKAEVLARVKSHLKLKNLTRELTEKNEALLSNQLRVEAELHAAAQLQRALLPRRPPLCAGLTAAWEFWPCQTLGGDIFDVFAAPDGRLCFYMLDVSGHGVPSALLTFSIAQSLSRPGREEVLAGEDRYAPGRVAARLEEAFPLERFDKFFTIFYGLMDPVAGRLTYVNAGHPPALLLQADGGLRKLPATAAMIGVGAVSETDQAEVAVSPGDRLALYTDGLLEYTDPAGEMFGERRFLELIGACGRRSLADMFQEVRGALDRFGQGAAPKDDISLLGLAFTGAPSEC